MLRLLYFNCTANVSISFKFLITKELESVPKALRVLKLCHEFLFEELEERCIDFIRRTMKLEDVSGKFSSGETLTLSDISDVATTWEIDGLKKQIQSTLQTNDYNMLPAENLIKVIGSYFPLGFLLIHTKKAELLEISQLAVSLEWRCNAIRTSTLQ